jgi:hypothetical protein
LRIQPERGCERSWEETFLRLDEYDPVKPYVQNIIIE